jgi:predicted RNase H-like HicB family nuclease
MSSMFNVDERNRYCVGMTIKAVIHKAEEGGFWAEVPALPGCVTQGETMEELRTNLEDAIKLWLEAGEPEIAGIEGDEIVELAI